MPRRLAALPGDRRRCPEISRSQARSALRGGRAGSGRLQPAPRLDSLDARRALPLHARRGLAASAPPRASWRARTGSSARPGAPPSATRWSAACCLAGSLEDIGDWWTWLSTSCYTWRGLDSAAWALAQINHPEAQRIRKEADAYHTHLLANFREAADRSPVVRLRDGTAVPHIPSMVHRRGRYFGWICETLEGSMHLLITARLDAAFPGSRLDPQGLRGQPLPLRTNTATRWRTSTNTGLAAAACPCRPACCWTSSLTSTAMT